ncbi:MAG: SAM-dependent methyltransferase, partial [Bryobacteraceae bacterium]
GKPSKTSIVTMAARAIGSHDPDPSVRNPDWLAERFLGAEERALLPDLPLMLGVTKDYREALKDKLKAFAVPGQIVRTRIIDEQLEKAILAGATQVVILGAGFDSRAYRFRQLLRNVKVFEVDYGPTQEYKKRRVHEVLGTTPPNLVYAPIDFTREKLGAVLRKRGYRPDRKSFFIWEGVTMYIPEEAVRETLQFIARDSAPASSVVFDYYTKSFVERDRGPSDPRASWSEPVIFGLPDGAEREFVKGTGLDLVEQFLMSGPEAVRRYVTRRDGSLVGTPGSSSAAGHYWLAVATLPVPGGGRSASKK